jgi:bacillopeptidase F
MKTIAFSLVAVIAVGCKHLEVDRTPPAAPRGVKTISLDNAIEIQWLENTEPDVRGYNVWSSSRYEGPYTLIGTTTAQNFVDYGARNGLTYYYALSAFDFEGNESGLTQDVIYDTPRPEGYGVIITDYRVTPATAGYDFSTFSIGPYNDRYTDVFFETFSGRHYFNVWSDTDIQDMGYTKNLDEISVAPSAGWSPSGSAEAIVGHTYVVWTWDDHYAKIRVKEVTDSRVVFDWAYQTAAGNPELKRDFPRDGQRKPLSRREVALR